MPYADMPRKLIDGLLTRFPVVRVLDRSVKVQCHTISSSGHGIDKEMGVFDRMNATDGDNFHIPRKLLSVLYSVALAGERSFQSRAPWNVYRIFDEYQHVLVRRWRGSECDVLSRSRVVDLRSRVFLSV